MTDIGTASHTIIAQTTGETMGLPLHEIVVRLDESARPVSSGSGGQWGANCSAADTHAAHVEPKHGLNTSGAVFADDEVRSGGRRVPLVRVAGADGLVPEDAMEEPAIANRVHNVTGVRVRDDPTIFDELLGRTPDAA